MTTMPLDDQRTRRIRRKARSWGSAVPRHGAAHRSGATVPVDVQPTHCGFLRHGPRVPNIHLQVDCIRIELHRRLAESGGNDHQREPRDTQA